MKLNIYLVQTKNIIERIDFIQNDTNPAKSIFVDINKLYNLDATKGFDFYIIDENIKSNSFSSRMKSQVNIVKNVESTIDEILTNYTITEINLVYQNVEDVVSNYFFFYFSQKKKQISGVIVEDGLANYHIEILTLKRVASTLLKKTYLLLSFFHFYKIPFSFRKWKADLLGINNKRCKKQYLCFPEFSPFNKYNNIETIRLPTKKINIKPIPNKALILGQETYALPQFIGLNRYSEKFNDLYIYLKKNKVNLISYKRHNLLQNTGFHIDKYIDIEIIDSIIPVESLLSEINPSIVISFDSSALFYIKLLSSSEIDVISYPIYYNSFNELFSKIGIRTINKNDC